MEKYSLVQRLGQGSFAVVWKARRKSDGHLVAVKQLRQSPDSWEACKQLPEVKAQAAINDRRHVVQLLEAVRHGGELFLVFEYVEGSLHHCAAQGRRLEEPQVRWAARRLLAALAAVHAAGLVHCDVKPENILVGDRESIGGPTLKLCDFGQAMSPDMMGSYVGTRWYRAPELLLNARGDAGVDLWAAGCVLAELFLRRPLVPGTDSRDMLFRICGELGAPEEDDGWALSSRMVEASGRANASAAAWEALAAAGASELAINMLSLLLRYDASRRWRADRALRSPFFNFDAPETPVPLPFARPLSPETRRRQRDEAAAVERKLKAQAAPGRGGSPAGCTSRPDGLVPGQTTAASSSRASTMRDLWAAGLLPGDPSCNKVPGRGSQSQAADPVSPPVPLHKRQPPVNDAVTRHPSDGKRLDPSPSGAVSSTGGAEDKRGIELDEGSDDDSPVEMFRPSCKGRGRPQQPQAFADVPRTGEELNPKRLGLDARHAIEGELHRPLKGARGGSRSPMGRPSSTCSEGIIEDDEELAERFWTEVTRESLPDTSAALPAQQVTRENFPDSSAALPTQQGRRRRGSSPLTPLSVTAPSTATAPSPPLPAARLAPPVVSRKSAETFSGHGLLDAIGHAAESNDAEDDWSPPR